MKTTFETRDMLVIDDFLSPSEHALVWNYMQSESFRRVHAGEWVNAWRLSDGEPMRGPVYLSNRPEVDRINDAYPTGKGVDLLFRAILALEDRLVPWIGRRGEDFLYFFARSYLYPAGTGLSWHRDNKNNVTGAFSYYAHPTWNVQWGGELLVADGSTKDFEFPHKELYGEEPRFLGTHLDNSVENEKLLEVGVGQYIVPKPNRFVVITAGVLHSIKKVDAAAGNNVRSTLQGFFMYPDKPQSPP